MAFRYLAAVLVLAVAGCSQRGPANPGSNVTSGQSASAADPAGAVTNANLVTFTVPGMD